MSRAMVLLPERFFETLPGRKVTSGRLTSDDTAHLAESDQLAGEHDEYARKYLLGTASYPGLLRQYHRNGWTLEVWEESQFRSAGFEPLDAFDHFDFQLATYVGPAIVHALLARGRTEVGWCHPSLGKKHNQIRCLLQSDDTSGFVPRQKFFVDLEALIPFPPSAVAATFASPFLIAKAIQSARSKMTDGSDYRVFRADRWDQFVRTVAASPQWIGDGGGLVVCELIESRDPFLGNRNGVVHKIHLPTGLPEEMLSEWSLRCHRIDAKLHLERVGDRICELGELYEPFGWSEGNLELYRSPLTALLREIFPLPCLFSIDLMIDGDGRLFFLEMNKIAATYLHPLGEGNRCPLEIFVDRTQQMARESWRWPSLRRRLESVIDDADELSLADGRD